MPRPAVSCAGGPRDDPRDQELPHRAQFAIPRLRFWRAEFAEIPRAVRTERLGDDRSRQMGYGGDRIPGYLLGHVSALGAEKLTAAAAMTKTLLAGAK